MNKKLTPEEAVESRRFLKIFERRNPDGTYYYSDADVRAFLPVLVIQGKLDASGSPALKRVMGEFAEKVGFKPSMTPEQIRKAIEDWFKAHPLRPELLQELRHFSAERFTP